MSHMHKWPFNIIIKLITLKKKKVIKHHLLPESLPQWLSVHQCSQRPAPLWWDRHQICPDPFHLEHIAISNMVRIKGIVVLMLIQTPMTYFPPWNKYIYIFFKNILGPSLSYKEKEVWSYQALKWHKKYHKIRGFKSFRCRRPPNMITLKQGTPMLRFKRISLLQN